MSGPKGARYRFSEQLAHRAAAEARRSAEQEDREREARRAEEAERHRQQVERQRREAEARARAEEARRLEAARLERLAQVRAQRRRLLLARETLAATVAGLPPGSDAPTLPDVPEIVDESMPALESAMRSLEAVADRLDQIGVRVNAAGALKDLRLNVDGHADTVSAMLDKFMAARRGLGQKTGSNRQPDTPELRRTTLDRIIGKLLDVSIDELPPALESLMQRAISVDSSGRFDMLHTEISLQVQQHNDRVRRRRLGMRAAADWLDRLLPLDEAGDHADLLEALADARLGSVPWDDGLERACQSAHAELLAAAQARSDRRAAAVLEATLRDLGYEVDGIAETLFTEGGTVHFQGRGWNDYYMRLRVSPDRDALHFNMVRSTQGRGDAQQDLEMEQRWCSGYPQLMQTLAARGIESTPLKALAAGTFAVETVQPESLPTKQSTIAEQRARAGPALQARRVPE